MVTRIASVYKNHGGRDDEIESRNFDWMGATPQLEVRYRIRHRRKIRIHNYLALVLQSLLLTGYFLMTWLTKLETEEEMTSQKRPWKFDVVMASVFPPMQVYPLIHDIRTSGLRRLTETLSMILDPPLGQVVFGFCICTNVSKRSRYVEKATIIYVVWH